MIHIQGLTKTYGSRAHAVTALRDVSLDLAPGVWGVVGPNGAGKTTLLGLILGFLRPSSGSVTLEGEAPRRYLRHHGAAYLPERFRLPVAWPVRRALLSLARLEGHDSAIASARTDAVLERLGLADYAARPMGTLSRGLTQRVGLAQALLADRSLVVLDEPTEGLDPLWRVRFREIVDELRGQERTVLLASHEISEVERLADGVIVLDDGRVTELMDARQPAGGPLRYRLTVGASAEVVRLAFPTAEIEGEVVPAQDRDPSRRTAAPFVVDVADVGELTHRLAALLAEGAVIHAVIPVRDDLETRVRNRLEES